MFLVKVFIEERVSKFVERGSFNERPWGTNLDFLMKRVPLLVISSFLSDRKYQARPSTPVLIRFYSELELARTWLSATP